MTVLYIDRVHWLQSPLSPSAPVLPSPSSLQILFHIHVALWLLRVTGCLCGHGFETIPQRLFISGHTAEESVCSLLNLSGAYSSAGMSRAMGIPLCCVIDCWLVGSCASPSQVNKVLWDQDWIGWVMLAKHCFSALSHISSASVLSTVFHIVSWALEGVVRRSYLGLSIQLSLILSTWPATCFCVHHGSHEEASLSKSESSVCLCT